MVVIVDNCSPTGDGDQLEERLLGFDGVETILIKSSRNGGFAAGNNLAFEQNSFT